MLHGGSEGGGDRWPESPPHTATSVSVSLDQGLVTCTEGVKSVLRLAFGHLKQLRTVRQRERRPLAQVHQGEHGIHVLSKCTRQRCDIAGESSVRSAAREINLHRELIRPNARHLLTDSNLFPEHAVNPSRRTLSEPELL